MSLAAGFSSGTYNALCNAGDCGIGVSGIVWGNQGFGHTDPDLPALVKINAASSIDESLGTLGAVLLTGGAGGFAGFSGGPATVVSQNWIVSLGSFDSNLLFDLPVTGTLGPGLLLRDGRVPATGPGLSVVGTVQDHGTVIGGNGSDGLEISVAPTADAVADLALQSGALIADGVTGTVDIQATGNVYETGGSIAAAALIAQAGAVPGTEAGGNTPGTIPTDPLARASVWLGNLNQIGTLADATATQEFLLDNGPSLLIPSGGAVLAGAAPASTVAANTDGTPIVVNPNPAATINISNGDLSVGGVLHAGLDGTSPRRAPAMTCSPPTTCSSTAASLPPPAATSASPPAPAASRSPAPSGAMARPPPDWPARFHSPPSPRSTKPARSAPRCSAAVPAGTPA